MSDGWWALESGAGHPLLARSFLNSAWVALREFSERKDSTMSSTWAGGALAGALEAGFDLLDFFAMAVVDSLAVAVLADELLPKSQEGGPDFCADIRFGNQPAV